MTIERQETARIAEPEGQDRTFSRAAEISRGMVGLVSRYTGRGPTKVRTTLNTNVALVVLEDMLAKGEQNLVAAGEVEAVAALRTTYQSAMRQDAIELVESILDRKVAAALGDVDPARNVAVEVFVLERVPETGITETAEYADPSD